VNLFVHGFSRGSLAKSDKKRTGEKQGQGDILEYISQQTPPSSLIKEEGGGELHEGA